jgi:hypothetical protein
MDLRLRLHDVGAAQQQLRRHAGRRLRRQRIAGEQRLARDRSGRTAEQRAHLIFGGDDLLLDLRDRRGRVVQRRLGALDRQLGVDAALEAAPEERFRLGKGLGRIARDLELQIELLQAEVRLRDGADE